MEEVEDCFGSSCGNLPPHSKNIKVGILNSREEGYGPQALEKDGLSHAALGAL